VRPLTFWIFVAAMIFVAMTLLWGFGDEPTGTVFVISAVLYWGSGIALIFLGLVAISRWRRPPGGTRDRATDTRRDRPSRV
jgi:hypothetical protein